jgi:hypothetical protein
MLIACSCPPEPDPIDPQPFTDAEDYVITATQQWLDVRMDNDLWIDFSSPTADWRQADSLDNLCTALDFIGNFSRKLADMRDSERFKIDDDDRLLYVIKHALSTYVYEEY